MSRSGFSATSGSRLFMSIRSAASWCQPLQLISLPRGARMTRRSLIVKNSFPDRGGDAADIGRQGAVLLHRRRNVAHAFVGLLDPSADLQRPAKLQAFRGREQLDSEQVFRVLH